jgi:hypothetical protein
MASFNRGLDHWCLVCNKKSWASCDKCSQCICVPQNNASVPSIEAEAEPPPLSSSAGVIEAAAPDNPVSAGDQSEPSAVVADVQEAVAEAKLEAGAQSKLLPQYTNIEVHNALHAYGTLGTTYRVLQRALNDGLLATTSTTGAPHVAALFTSHGNLKKCFGCLFSGTGSRVSKECLKHTLAPWSGPASRKAAKSLLQATL